MKSIEEQIANARLGETIKIKNPFYESFEVRKGYSREDYTWCLKSKRFGFYYPTKGTKVLHFKTVDGARRNLLKYLEQ